MTIVKAIALAALTGTLAFAPQAALADSQKGGQSGEHGNSAAAKATPKAAAEAWRLFPQPAFTQRYLRRPSLFVYQTAL